MYDSIKLRGDVTITKTNEAGNILETREVKNLVVTTGKTFIISRMAANTTAVMTQMAIGSGNSAPVVGDTALGTELGRANLTVAGGTASGNTVTYAAAFAAGTGTGAITEAGIFNPGNVMLCRTTYPVLNKTANDAISISWVVTAI